MESESIKQSSASQFRAHYHRPSRPHPGSRHTLTSSPRALEVILWLLVRAVYRFYLGSAGRSARGRIPGKSCRGRYGSRADRFVSWSDPGRSAIDTARSFQAFSNLSLTTLLYQPGNRKGKAMHAHEFSRSGCFLSLVDGAAGLP